MSDLKPCPFCGSINLGTVPDDLGFSWTECLDCGAGGPDGNQSQRGVTWNNRTIPTVTDEQADRAIGVWLGCSVQEWNRKEIWKEYRETMKDAIRAALQDRDE